MYDLWDFLRFTFVFVQFNPFLIIIHCNFVLVSRVEDVCPDVDDLAVVLRVLLAQARVRHVAAVEAKAAELRGGGRVHALQLRVAALEEGEGRALLLGDVVLHLGRGAQLLDRRPEEVSHELDDGALPPRPVVVLIVLALLEQLEPGQPGNPELK